MFSPSPMHLLVLGLIVVLVLGPKRLPEIARSLGRGLRELKGSMSDDLADAPSATALVAASDAPTATELAEARQATPAATPEIAAAELATQAPAETRVAA
jgi:sec-independent protein translocase protein TatA